MELDTGRIDFAHDFGTNATTLNWSLDNAFAVSLPAPVDVGGVVTIDRVRIGKEEAGTLLMEFGIQPSGTGEVSIQGLPNVLGVRYDPNPQLQPPKNVDVFLKRSGEAVTILVPGVLYATGSLERGEASGALPSGSNWGPPLRGSLRAFMVGNGSAVEPQDHLRKESYMLDVEVGLLSATRSDGLQALVVTLDAGFRPGIAIGTSGASLYGVGLTYAQNAQPAAQDGDYATWFMDAPAPKFSTHATKWEPKAGSWGFGAAVTVGSAPDNGRSFNVAAGTFPSASRDLQSSSQGVETSLKCCQNSPL